MWVDFIVKYAAGSAFVVAKCSSVTNGETRARETSARLTGFPRLSLGCLRAGGKRTPGLQVVRERITSSASSPGSKRSISK